MERLACFLSRSRSHAYSLFLSVTNPAQLIINYGHIDVAFIVRALESCSRDLIIMFGLSGIAKHRRGLVLLLFAKRFAKLPF